MKHLLNEIRADATNPFAASTASNPAFTASPPRKKPLRKTQNLLKPGETYENTGIELTLTTSQVPPAPHNEERQA